MKRMRVMVLATLVPLLAGCTTAFAPTSMNVADLANVDFSNVQTMKQGESCATTILGLFTDGEAMVTTAARLGGISKVEVVEHKFSGNPLFSKQCVIVFGR